MLLERPRRSGALGAWAGGRAGFLGYRMCPCECPQVILLSIPLDWNLPVVFAGHETTASLMAWMTLELVKHPRDWHRAMEEALAADGPPTSAEELARFPLMEFPCPGPRRPCKSSQAVKRSTSPQQEFMMRKILGALCVVGLMAGCGGAVEEQEPTQTSAVAPVDGTDGKVGAQAVCKPNVAYYARYYYDQSGRECGLKYWFCDGREAGRGCETSTFNELYNCSCP